MNTYLKILARMFRKHLTRFLSIVFIVLISVGFVSGIGWASDKIDRSATDYYKERNVSDFIVKSTGNGFGEEEIGALRLRYGEENVDTGMSVDVYMDMDGDAETSAEGRTDGKEQLVRLYFFDDSDGASRTVNVPDLSADSSVGGTEDEILVFAEKADNRIKGFAAGTRIGLDFGDILAQLAEQQGKSLNGLIERYLEKLLPVTVTVAGEAQSPLTFGKTGEPSYLNGLTGETPTDVSSSDDLLMLDNILYLPSSVIPCYKDLNSAFESDERLLPTEDIYVALPDREAFKAFSTRYGDYVAAEKAALAEILGGEVSGQSGYSLITLYDNYSFASLHSYADRVTHLGYVLMVAFLFVTALVTLSGMTRLMEEERSQIACLKTLGYSPFLIILRYLLFAAAATAAGGFGAYFVGGGLAELIYYVFNYNFVMPPVSSHLGTLFFALTLTVIVAATLVATALSGVKLNRESPAALLRPKPPRAGQKVFIEKIPLIWNRLSFKYKSTVRNVLRYKNRFFMTVVAVAFSTALVLAGMALLDVCLSGAIRSASITAIAVVVVVFAGLLTATVVYTLTNINVSERNRELATLMVLGYHDGEVEGYIQREIYIDVSVGILCGYPVSVPIMLFLFDIMSMGTLGGVAWFVWVSAPVVVLLFTALVTLILRRRIVRIDMNESLKAVG